jgi:TFIIF-interacting CTD phosphatase-like protein
MQSMCIVNSLNSQMYIMIRPYAREVLAELAKDFELVVFTASCPEYAEIIVDLLEEKQEYFDFILH